MRDEKENGGRGGIEKQPQEMTNSSVSLAEGNPPSNVGDEVDTKMWMTSSSRGSIVVAAALRGVRRFVHRPNRRQAVPTRVEQRAILASRADATHVLAADASIGNVGV